MRPTSSEYTMVRYGKSRFCHGKMVSSFFSTFFHETNFSVYVSFYLNSIECVFMEKSLKNLKNYVLVIMLVKLTVRISEKPCFRFRQKVSRGQLSCLVFQLSIEWAFLVDNPIDQLYFFELRDIGSSSI